jgi:hypothetical protein
MKKQLGVVLCFLFIVLFVLTSCTQVSTPVASASSTVVEPVESPSSSPTQKPTPTVKSTPTPTVKPTPSPTPTPNPIPEDAISWDDAIDHVGESDVQVYGKVAGTRYAESSRGKPTFLKIGVDYPDDSRCTAVIWGDNRSAFLDILDTGLTGKTIIITGDIDIYQGVAQVELKDPSQIEVVDE